MSLSTIKNSLHEQIEKISDKNVLLVIEELLTQNYRTVSELKLSVEQADALEKSKADFISGRILSRDKAAAQVAAWLRKNH